ncbi:MAG: Cof-type HAD-IIB family hydrolase [Candidatus Izemoplasma sp.]
MNKKLIFMDLDGTILDHSTNSIPESARNTIKELQNNGHTVIISTGRCPSIFYGIDKELGIKSYIAANGRYVLHNGEVLLNDYIDKEVVQKLVDMAYSNKIDIAFEDADDYVLNSDFTELSGEFSKVFHLHQPLVNHNYHLTHDILQMVMFYNGDDYLKFETEFPTLSFHFANEYGLDINEKGGMKEIGVKVLVEKLGYSYEDTIAIGDGFNDISMIEIVGTGIAMGNANEELKETADFVTDDISNDGLYKAFKKLKLI